ncbi:hypothetical protein N7453_006976 [Penicillium expansum]|nr:hypothetical protein N7453_006976 [Penicillium expansum]
MLLRFIFDTSKLPYYALISVIADHKLCAPVYPHRQEPTALLHEEEIAAIWMFSHTKGFPVPVQLGPRDEFTPVIMPDKGARNHVLKPQQHPVRFDTRPMNTAPTLTVFRHKA